MNTIREFFHVFFWQMFDLRGKELKYAEGIVSESSQKICTKFCEVAGHAWVKLKL